MQSPRRLSSPKPVWSCFHSSRAIRFCSHQSFGDVAYPRHVKVWQLSGDARPEVSVETFALESWDEHTRKRTERESAMYAAIEHAMRQAAVDCAANAPIMWDAAKRGRPLICAREGDEEPQGTNHQHDG